MAEVTLMPSPHAEGAKALLDRLRALRAEIPRINNGIADGRTFSARSRVPDSFMESASVAVQVSARLGAAAGTDADRVRDAYAFALAYEAVVQELRAMARAVAHTIRAQRAQAAAGALNVYAFAARLSKQQDGAELVPYVEDMRRKLNSKRARRSTEPAPAPAVNAAPSAAV